MLLEKTDFDAVVTDCVKGTKRDTASLYLSLTVL